VMSAWTSPSRPEVLAKLGYKGTMSGDAKQLATLTKSGSLLIASDNKMEKAGTGPPLCLWRGTPALDQARRAWVGKVRFFWLACYRQDSRVGLDSEAQSPGLPAPMLRADTI